ncbi:hypothetical protein U27_05000 [Candidatus Vecturithrix granuli]|uniref:site-specific DNA-methyltransferase (adenine-specific) n=1 Tax=Vecturithrix granuli TaxID=1499967 RepID=A0A081C0C2_VECG1|nr:hypothetical protein U27_05000 [Candidatus Vecturithrix granuli]
MKYSAITIQGNILTGEILEKIRMEDIRYQTPKDFGLEKTTTLREEIGIAWAAAKAHWQAFQLRRERLKDADTGTSETRQSWLLPLLRELGYDLEKANAEIINGKSYAISHRAVNRGNFPAHLVGINQSLDKRAEIGGTRLSPHALVQEYLNNQDHLYGLVSNGRSLRLLRDATRLSRLSYLEFDVERILSEDLFAEFALLFRVLHVTRIPASAEDGAESIIEWYHQEALASGSRIRERLSGAVEESLKLLANGLLKHPANEALRQKIAVRRVSAGQYYLTLLRCVYRMLFLLVIEERHLIFPDPECQSSALARTAKAEFSYSETRAKAELSHSGYSETRAKAELSHSGCAETRAKAELSHSIYQRFYSINRLAQLAEKAIYVDPRKTDLWQSLLTTFRLFETAAYGEKLGIKPLGSGLFAPNALGDFHACRLDNGTFLNVLGRLVTFENEHGQRVRVNYADLDVEEFGSVYEGLLEYEPEFRGLPPECESSAFARAERLPECESSAFARAERLPECESSTFAHHAPKQSFGTPVFVFVKGQARSASGSHYTPEELVKPLIEHSLEYVIQECQSSALASHSRKQSFRTPEESLLSIRVADVACGSGHILLSAARRIGLELARVRSGEDQPAPPVIRQAVRDVIRHCIYGVDKNLLAVELCKVALWLEAHAPGEPLNFLDHHIKCGDAIVGLAHKEELLNGIADEAFKTLPGDDKSMAAALAKRNRQERKQREQMPLNFAGVVEEPLERILARWQAVDAMPERTPEEIAAKSAAYQSSIGGAHWWRLKTLADMQTAQFFIPKTEDKKTGCATDADFREFLKGRRSLQERAATLAIAIAQEKRFFHYFLEFPEVLAQGGFDCVLGNPPFLGGRLISGTYGDAYFNYIHHSFSGLKGQADYVGYFFRRIFALIRKQGFQALIATNSISQGDTREGSLSIIQQQGGDINFAVRSMRWPGLAAVEVALVTIYKGKWQGNFVLNGRKVSQLSSYLDDSEQIGEPYPLYQNQNKSFKGSCVYGMGFTMMSEDAQVLILKDHKNKDVLYPFLNGEDVSNRPDQSPGRWVINFFDWEENFCRENYPDCFRIVEKDVKPERTRWEKDKNGDDIIGTYALRKPLPQKWWIYGEKRPKLYSTIAPLKRVLVVPVVSKYSTFCFEPSNIVYTDKLVIFAYDDFWQYALLANSFHHHWAWKYSSTLGAGTLSYSSTDAFETFPFPQNLTPVQEAELEQIGTEYHEFRRQLMLRLQLGLTKLYNQFHNPDLRPLSEAELAEAQTLDKSAFVKRFGKQTWELWSHLRKLPASPECESSTFARDEESPECESSTFARDAADIKLSYSETLAKAELLHSGFAELSHSGFAELSHSGFAELSHSGRFNAAVADIFRLRELHKTMDETVLQAYSWSAKALLSQPKQSFGTPIELSHSFYEVDYLPENDRIRYTIHPDARREILKRLLLLNHAIHADEVRAQAGQQPVKKAAKRKKSSPQAEELALF